MTMRHAGRLLGALVVAGALAVPASDAHAASGSLDARTRAEVGKVVRQFQRTNRTPGVLVGIWSPKGTYVRAKGVADLATGTPLRTDMQFKIASQTKTFTANLVLQLVGEESVSLDDHISKWVAWSPART
jgi:D-alanyl-D-alanine carboxypeptidase